MKYMNRHTLSLVTCVYGVEEYMEQYAHSIFSQTCTDIEYIFVNDGTKDRSMQILERVIEESYAHLRKNIVIINQENQGLPMARKTGISQATGEYILFADPDDWLSTNAIEKILGGVHNGEVLLLHPTSATNAEIMGRLIGELRARGYRFGTLDELTATESAS